MGYRDAPRDLPPRELDVRWRVQVERAARALYWLLVVRALLWAGDFFRLPAAARVVGLALAVASVWACWRLTDARPLSETRARARLRGWVRGVGITAVVMHVAPVVNERFAVPFSMDLPNVAFAMLGLLYVRELFRELKALDPEPG